MGDRPLRVTSACNRALNRRRLRAGVCGPALLAVPALLGMGIALPTTAQAGHTFTTNYPSGVYLANYPAGNPFTINNGVTITHTGGDGVYGDSSQASWTIVNGGSVYGSVHGMNFRPNATVTNLATGTIGGYGGILIHGTGIVSNAGSIGAAGTYGIAIDIISLGSVANTGTIHGGFAGVYLEHGGRVSNGNSGYIFGLRDAIKIRNGPPAYVYNSGRVAATGNNGVGVYLLIDGGTFVNHGGTVAVTGNNSYGVKTAGGPGYVTNTGRISATGTSSTGVYLGSSGTVSNLGSTAFIGGSAYGVKAGFFSTTVVNGGTISGGNGTAVALGPSNNLLILEPGQVFNGVVYGGAGSNTIWLEGSAGQKGTIHDIRPGGEYLNFQTLSVANNAYWTHEGTSTLANTYVLGTFANLGTFNGGVTLVNGGSLYNRSIGGTIGTIIGGYDGVIGVGGAARVTNAGTIIGTGHDGIYLGQGGSVANIGSAALISGAYHGVAVTGGAGAVSNAGTIIGASGNGVYLAAGGSVANLGSAALISGYDGVAIAGGVGTVTNAGTIIGTGNDGVFLGGGGTVVNSGTIIGDDGIYLGQGGSVANLGSTARIVGGYNGVAVTGGAGTVSNAGTIIGTSGNGVYLAAGGSVANLGSAALISGGSSGVAIAGGVGTVTNAGTIIGTSNNGVFLGGGGTVANSGAIIGAGHDGIYLGQGGSVANLGSTARISGAYHGVAVTGGAATVSNLGTIIGGTGAGIYFSDNGGTFNNTVLNRGTISGSGVAVQFGAGNDLLILQPGQVFNGVVDGAGGSNTIWLQGSVGQKGTIHDIRPGGEYLNFQTLSVANNAYWTHEGTSTLTNTYVLGTFANLGTFNGGVTLVNGGSLYNRRQGGTIGTIISGSYGVVGVGGPARVSNAGTIIGASGNGVYLAAGGSVANLGSAALISGGSSAVVIAGGVGTVTNAGTITGADGVQLSAGGSVANQGSAALISGANNGVYIRGGAGTVTNLGAIIGTIEYGVHFGDGAGTFNNTVLNGGTITGGNGTAVQFGAGNDLLILQPGQVFNGVVDGGAGSNTIWLEGAHGTIHDIRPGGEYLSFATLSVANGAYWTHEGTSTLTNTDVLGTFANLGTFNGGVTLVNGGSLYNRRQGGTIGTIIGGNYGVFGTGGPARVTNAGTITGLVDAIYLRSGGSVANQGSAALISGATIGVKVSGAAGTVTNAGIIRGTTGASVYFGVGNTFSNTVLNAGTISGGAGTAVQFGAGNDLLILQPGEVFNGLVEGGAGSNTILLQGSHGTIQGIGSEYVSFQNLTVALGAYWTLLGANTFVNGGNAGTLDNEGGLTDTGTFVNSGRITGPGTVVESGASALFENSGTMSTTLTLANGAGLYNQHGGRIAGGAYGVLSLGALSHVTNAGSITGTVAGVDLTAGGSVANLAGGVIIGGTYGIESAGRVTILNQGVILDAGGAGMLMKLGGSFGNSGSIGGMIGVKSYGGSATITNSGTIRGTSGPGIQLLDIGGTFANTVSNSGTIIGGNGTAVQFGAGNDLLILGSGAHFTGVVDGAGGNNTIELQGSFGTLSGLGTEYLHFQNLIIAGGASGTVAGGSIANTTITGTLVDIGSLTSSGTVSGPGALIIDGMGAVLDNHGTVDLTVTLTNGGSLDNEPGALIQGSKYGVVVANGTSTIQNLGTIRGNTKAGILFKGQGVVSNGTSAGNSPIGLPLIYGYGNGIAFTGTGGGTVHNYGTIRTGGTGTAGPGGHFGFFGYNGVTIAGSGTVTNKGPFATIYGYRGGVTIAGSQGYVLNQGTVTGHNRAGVALGGSGRVLNQGTRSLIYGYTNGVSIAGSHGYVLNQGTIRGKLGAGVRLTGGGSTVVNAGYIDDAGTAVQLSGGGNLLVLQTGAGFGGVVVGGTGGGIDLQGVGTLHDIRANGQYQGFTTLTMAGTYWQLAGSNTLSLTDVDQGRLAVDGNLTGPVSILSGGTLGGNGLITGSVTIGNGGTLAPGTSAGGVTTVGTLHVTGTVTLGSSGHLQTQVDGAGHSDDLAITGRAIFQGGTVDVVENAGVIAKGYTIVNTTAGITGGLPSVDVGTGSSAFLTPSLSFTGNRDDLVLTLVQTAALVTAAVTPNQMGVASALGQVEGYSPTGKGNGSTSTSFSAGASSGGSVTPTTSGDTGGKGSPPPSGSQGGFHGLTITVAAGDVTAGGTGSGTGWSNPAGNSPVTTNAVTSAATSSSTTSSATASSATTPLVTTSGGLTSGGTGGSGSLINALLLLNKSSAQSAFDQLSGELHADLSTVQLRTALMFGDSLSQQMQLAHIGIAGNAIGGNGIAGAGLLAAPGTSRFALGAGGQAYDLIESGGVAPGPVGPWSAWASGFGQSGGVAGVSGVHNLDYTIGGGAWGLDYRASPNLVMGGAWGYADADLGAQGLAGTGRVKSQQFGAYASYSGTGVPGLGAAAANWQEVGWYLDGAVSLGYNEDEVRRLVAFPGFSGLADGRTQAGQAMTSLEAGLPVTVAPQTVVTPFVGLQATLFRQAAFSEGGGGAIDLAEAAQTAGSVRHLLGGQVGQSFALGEGQKLGLEARVAWAHEYVAGGSTLTAGFASAPAASFAVSGVVPRRDSAVVRLGLSATLSPRSSFFLHYDGDIDGRDDSHSLQAGFRYAW